MGEVLEMEKYQMKYMFDWAASTCLWGMNDAAVNRFGCTVDISKLPLSGKLITYLNDLIERHDKALNWDNPTDNLSWTEEEQEKFRKEALIGYNEVCSELGDDFEIILDDDGLV